MHLFFERLIFYLTLVTQFFLAFCSKFLIALSINMTLMFCPLDLNEPNFHYTKCEP